MQALVHPMSLVPRFPGPLVVSLALHVGLLASATWMGLGPLEIRIAEPAPTVYLEIAAPTVRASAVSPPRAAARGHRQAVRRAAPRPVPPSVRPAPAPETGALAKVPAQSQETVPSSDDAAAEPFEPVMGDPAGTSEAAAHEEAPAPEADPELERMRSAYLASVRERLEKCKHYPYLLRRQGIAGTVLVTFTVEKSGRPGEIRAADGPHHPHLIEAAVRSVKAAAPFAPLPAELETELRIEVPLAFVLEDN